MYALALPSFKVVPQRIAAKTQSSRQTTRILKKKKFKRTMGVIDERTPLRKADGGGPPYMFMTNPNRLYRKQIHQFQCLICLSFLLLFATAVVITVLQSVENDVIDNNLDNSSSVEPLLQLSWPIKDKDVGTWKSSIDENVLNSALSSAQMSLAAKDMLEENMDSLPPDSPSYKHQRSVKTSLRATYLARTGYMLDVATKNVLKSTPGKENSKSVGRSSTLKNSVLPSDICGSEKETLRCSSSPYRTVDGTCNNLNNAEKWGVAMKPFRRALPPDYADGISAPRKATDGSDLPSAREVSVSVHRPEYRGDYDFTVMLAVWGQFLDHDITATALSQGKNGGTISCCGKSPSELHPECFPVSVGPNDPYFKNISCLEFVRSAPAPTCSLGPREQLNQASSYIDGSVVYGNTDELMSSLRSYENGQLRMTVTPDGRTLLPISTDPADGCNIEEENAKGRYCFAAGDARANENIHLTTMHLIMARQHNSIATQLSAINPNWDDETLYQESRKIVAAQMQHITYSEFLPILLGDTIMKKLELSSNMAGYNDKYDPTVDATASNNFATASFRFAHTLLPGLMSMMKTMDEAEKVELHQLLFDPYKLYSPGYLDSALAGAMNTPLERMDNYFNKELTENLFKQPGKPCGLDLVSLNIQRGRDHGLPGYPTWREHCGLSRPSTFDDLKGYVDEDSLSIMSTLYKSVDDIDLYTGALSEYPTQDGILGPTFTCLIGDQFKRLKAGDRFWYETNEQPQAFSDAQLNEIRKTSLAGIICNTADAVDSVRSKVMQSLTPDNQQVPCQQIPQADLTVWSDVYQSEANKVTAFKKTAMFPTSIVMGLHVNQVTMENDDGSTWSGQPPVNVDMSVFNGPSVGPTHRLPPTVQWTTSSVTILPTKLNIAGSYSAVNYVFGKPGIFNFTVNQLTGKFLLDADILWNNTDVSAVLLNDATFSTSLFFSSRSPKNVTFNIAEKLKFVNVVPQNKKSIPPFKPSGKGPQSAIIVSGNYSMDKSMFYWPGNLTLTLPFNVVTDPVLQYVNSKKLSLINDGGLSKGGVTRSLFKVSGGTVAQAFGDGSEEILWNGKIPVTIPLVSPTGTPLSKELSAVLSITEVVPNVKGTFSMPNFIRGAGFNVTWTSGEFNLLIDALYNTSFASIIKPGYKYYTKIFLSPITSKVMDNDLFSWNDLGQYNTTTQMEGLISAGLDAIDSVIPITIVLQGIYSPDKTSFNWFGEGILNVKNVTEFIENSEKQKKLLSSPVINGPVWSKTAFGGSITGGHAAVKSNGFFSFEKTVWSGSLPVAIPVKYLSGNFSSYLFTLGVYWSGNLLGNTVEGKFSIPQFTGDWFPYPSVQRIDGSFSFDVQPLWNTSLEGLLLPGANYYSKVQFQGIKTPVVNNLESTQGDILDFSTSQSTGTELSAPIILQGTFSPDKTLFYWTGSFIISFRSGITGVGSVSFVKGKLTGSQKATLGFVLGSSIPSQESAKLKKPTNIFGAKSKQFGATVVSGNVDVNIDNDTTVNVWSGSLPINIPKNVFQAMNFYNYCIPWSGSLSGSVFEGSFSFPNISNNGSVLNVSWFDGNFKLNVLPLWFTSLDGAIVPGKKYCLNVFFQGNSTSLNKTKSSTVPVNIGSSFPSVAIFKGNYSIDESIFYWGGQTIISFKNASTITPKLTFSLVSMEDGSTTVNPPEPTKPTRAPKPPKPTKGPKPPKPNKKSISFTVTSGNVMAGLEGVNTTSVWNGMIPLKMKLDDIVQANSYSPMALVSWSGTPTATSLEGKFSFPVNIHNGTVTVMKNWIGNFSLQFITKWSGDMEAIVNPRLKYNCRLLFNEFSKKSVLLSSSDGGLQASGDTPTQCNVIVVGTFYKKPFYCSILPFMCSDDTIFTWSGDLIMTFVLPPDPVTPSPDPPQNSLYSSELKKLTNGNGTQRRVFGKVLSGSLSAGLSGESKKQLWSGSIPATIPLPVFWAPTTDAVPVPYEDDKVYGHGAIWSGSIFGTTVHGTFSLPQYTWNGAASSIRWWNGDFSVQVMSLWETDLGNLIIPGLKFNSRLIFRDLANATTNVLLSSSPSQYEVDSAYNAPLILLGTYSNDRKIFYWSGQFIIGFQNVPDVNLYSY